MDRKRHPDCLTPPKGGGVSARGARINRSMKQASCCQARRPLKRGAQQSTDCEHPSKRGNAAWRHETPLQRPVGRRAGISGPRAFSFGSFSFKPYARRRRDTDPESDTDIDVARIISSMNRYGWALKAISKLVFWFHIKADASCKPEEYIGISRTCKEHLTPIKARRPSRDGSMLPTNYCV